MSIGGGHVSLAVQGSGLGIWGWFGKGLGFDTNNVCLKCNVYNAGRGGQRRARLCSWYLPFLCYNNFSLYFLRGRGRGGGVQVCARKWKDPRGVFGDNNVLQQVFDHYGRFATIQGYALSWGYHREDPHELFSYALYGFDPIFLNLFGRRGQYCNIIQQRGNGYQRVSTLFFGKC